jgi:hypothetical protein
VARFGGSPLARAARRKGAEELDWRTRCRRDAACQRQYVMPVPSACSQWSKPTFLWCRYDQKPYEMLKWICVCGHHTLLRKLLLTRPDMRCALQAKSKHPYISHSDHPTLMAMLSDSLPTIGLVAAEAGVPVSALMQAAEKGSLDTLEVLMRHFVEHQAGLSALNTPSAASGGESPDPRQPTAEVMRLLDEALLRQPPQYGRRGSGLTELFLLAGLHPLICVAFTTGTDNWVIC